VTVSQRNLADGRESGVVQKQPLNVYTVMLIVAFFAISIACLLLYLELKRWGSFPWWKAQTGATAAYIYQSESLESVSPVRLV
jgi:hypothetical protein